MTLQPDTAVLIFMETLTGQLSSGDSLMHRGPQTKWKPFCTKIFKRISLNEKFFILKKISLCFVPTVSNWQ